MAQVLTIHDDGRTIQLGVGTRLELRLPDNPSTGYRWSVEADSRFVTVEEGVYTQLVHGLGGGGERQWWINTCQTGCTTLRLSRWRPWESESSAIERFAVTLEILSGHPWELCLKVLGRQIGHGGAFSLALLSLQGRGVECRSQSWLFLGPARRLVPSMAITALVRSRLRRDEPAGSLS